MYYDVLDSGNKINISRDVMTRRKSRVFFFIISDRARIPIGMHTYVIKKYLKK